MVLRPNNSVIWIQIPGKQPTQKFTYLAVTGKWLKLQAVYLWHVGENLQVKLRNWNKRWLYLFQSVFKLYHPILVLLSPASRNSFIHLFLRSLKNNSCQWLCLSVVLNSNFPVQRINDWKKYLLSIQVSFPYVSLQFFSSLRIVQMMSF